MNLKEITHHSKTICITCGKEGRLLPLFIKSNSEYVSLILRISDVKISQNDGFSRNICRSCLSFLRKVNEFKAKCERTFAKLQKLSATVEDDLSDLRDIHLFKSIFPTYDSSSDNIIEPIAHINNNKNENKHEEEIDIFTKYFGNYLITQSNSDKYDSNEIDVKSDGSNIEEHFYDDITYSNNNSHKNNSYRISENVSERNIKKSKQKKLGRNFNEIAARNATDDIHIYFTYFGQEMNPNEKHSSFKYSKSVKQERGTVDSLVDNVKENYSANCSDSDSLIDKLKESEISKDRIVGDINLFLKYFNEECNMPKNVLYGCRTVRKNKVKDKNYANKNRLQSKVLKTKKGPVKCRVCHKTLANIQSLRSHSQQHEGYRIICEQCGKGFSCKRSLEMHCMVHHGMEKTLSCKFCDYKGLRKLDIEIHERTHTGERPYICDICGKSFFRRFCLFKHVQRHSDQKKNKCQQCDKAFFLPSELYAHMNGVHERAYLFKCYLCNTMYARITTVRKHLIQSHSIPRDKQGKVLRVNLQKY